MLQKKKILDLPFVYTANAFIRNKELFIGAGSERKNPAYIVNAGDESIEKITDGPGGMMSLLPLPGSDTELFSVMGLFPPFIGAEAGVYRHIKKNGFWSTQKVLSLPFAHRCEILTYNGTNHLFVASVSRFKENPADWSRPGELHHTVIGNDVKEGWQTEIILSNLFRNHGMTKSMINGTEMICISGSEGIFGVSPVDDNEWKITRLFDSEVSEFSFFDIDNDGQDELAVIEPFHGNLLAIYKKEGLKWQKLYSSPLSFGHGLSAGIFKNQKVVVAGNRRDSEALEMHIVKGNGTIEMEVIEEHAGPTQTKVFNNEGTDYILSSNQVKNEVALYY